MHVTDTHAENRHNKIQPGEVSRAAPRVGVIVFPLFLNSIAALA
jgi:hypothetical protein